jgi:ADP-ribose pyrophosphatase
LAIGLEQRTSSSRVYDGRILNLRVDQVVLDGGRATTREIVEHLGAAAIVPITEDGSVVLVRQYRYAVSADLLEVPAGTLEAGETPEECAARELEEETGYRSAQLMKVMEFFPAPGYTTEKIHVYLARGLRRTEAKTEEDEQITVEILPIATALDKVRSGEIRDAKSICALFRAAELL